MKRLTLCLLTIAFLSGCSNSLLKSPETPERSMFKMPSWLDFSMPSIEVYKPTIIQGSVLEIKAVEKLQLGMSKNTVIDLIGSPSINDPFHQYQWDYIHHSIINGEQVIHYRLRLIFDGNTLAEIDKSKLDGLTDNQE